jgi:DNA-binding transcriptional LysR family regulator
MSYARTMFTGLPELIVSEYQRRFPGVEITADSGTTGLNVERLRSGELDIAFVLTPLEDAGDLRCVDISREPIVVALPSAHPLSQRRRIRREDLAGLPLVYLPRHQAGWSWPG